MDIRTLKTCLNKGSFTVSKFDLILISLLQQEDKSNFNVILLMLYHLCDEIKAVEGDNAVKVYPSYTLARRWKPVIVVLEKTLNDRTMDKYRDWTIVRRRYDLVSTEGAEVMDSKEAKSNTMDFKKMEAISDSISEHQLAIHNSNITHVSVCTCRKRDAQIQIEDCIVVYCLLKHYIPFDENPLPTHLVTEAYGNIPVDVREGFCTFCMQNGLNATLGYQHRESKLANSFNKKLLMGTEIRTVGDRNFFTGTLGAFVKRNDGINGFLTCSHVVKPKPKEASHVSNGQDVVQPGICSDHFDGTSDTCETSRICGNVLFDKRKGLTKVGVGVDVAFVEVTERYPDTVDFVFIPPEQFTAADTTGPLQFDGSCLKFKELREEHFKMDVLKVGKTTGLTCGKLIYHKCQAFIDKDITFPDDETELFHNQLEIQSLKGTFADKGDSGSIVFLRYPDDGSLVCLGMLIATTPSRTAIVTPIDVVLKAVKAELIGNKTDKTVSMSCTGSMANRMHSHATTSCRYSNRKELNIPLPAIPDQVIESREETEMDWADCLQNPDKTSEETMEHSHLNDLKFLDFSNAESSSENSLCRQENKPETSDASTQERTFQPQVPPNRRTDHTNNTDVTTSTKDGRDGCRNETIAQEPLLQNICKPNGTIENADSRMLHAGISKAPKSQHVRENRHTLQNVHTGTKHEERHIKITEEDNGIHAALLTHNVDINGVCREDSEVVTDLKKKKRSRRCILQ